MTTTIAPTTVTVKPEIWIVGEDKVFIDGFTDEEEFATNWKKAKVFTYVKFSDLIVGNIMSVILY